MKKFFFFLSAFALLGLTAACNEDVPVNPNFNAERGDVKTSFIINVATTSQTKASAAEVQATTNEAFRGMEKIKLYMSKGYNTAYLGLPYQYDLGTLTPAYGDANLTNEGAINADKSRRVYNLTIPTGVDNMVFYAKAKEAGANNATTGTAAVKSNNKIEYTVDADKTKTNFKLVPIIEQDDSAQGTATTGADGAAVQADLFTTNANAVKLLEILNSFTEIVDDWKALDVVELLTAYDNYFTTNETLRQGSGPAVLRTMQDMYKIAARYPAPEQGTPTDAQNVCAAIREAIEEYFDVKASDTTLTYKSANAALLQFPFEELGLPAGAAQVKCTTPEQGAPTFAWVNPSNTMDANTVDYKNIMYPAELCYWASSSLRISNTEGAEENQDYYPANWAKWNQNGEWKASYGWLDYAVADNRVVTKETRAVALHNNVLYGNALAKATVKMAQTTYEDNRQAVVPNVTNQKIEIDGSKKYFKVTGILIGGQPKQVEWDFVAGTQADRTGVIYDHAFADNKITTEASSPFYTMVLDNLLPNSQEQEVVYFALEIENHAGDFYGRDNVIYDGGKFYLAGSMKLTDDQINKLISNSDYTDLAELGYRVPPVDDDGVMIMIPRVFIQDFTTTMNITLGLNALKLAYATVPDLRPTQMFFGLSVDLTWKAGASFDVEIGKAN